MAKLKKLGHIHRWHVDLLPEGIAIRCLDYHCKGVLSIGEIENALNAVVSFPLQDAVQVLWCLEHAAGVEVGDEFDALNDYIEELEP